MSLVGTRPPTVDEWDKYELHHRARLATKPGLTGMWQVSGRSNITDLSIYLIIIMLPRHYYNGVWGILENGLLLIGIFLLIIKKYRPSKWNIVMTLYFIYFTVITFINQTDMADWHFILSNNLKEKLALERKEKAEYAKKVGQFTMQVDWLKKI